VAVRPPPTAESTEPPLGGSSPLFSLFTRVLATYYVNTQPTKGVNVAKEEYEAPQITVLGDVTDMTQSKPGFYFDYPLSAEGASAKAPPGTPGTGTS
jgi:hypothetical protein